MSSRMYQLVAFGTGKWYKGAEYLDFCSPDPLGGLGTMLQTHAVVRATVSDQEVTTVSDQEVTTSCAAAGFVQPRVV